ncbi:hypothetical protein BD310DRAFT_257494 [Dichomitus squalens]|uniref:Uncharacterized protein n=1 Tax=Dichomitus squalens TaxID=114155 RepID=A0A4Q9PC73_9APHY|nr:hypothetical protein BD310DRAFT_257494 [Dichomitus squalens]
MPEPQSYIPIALSPPLSKVDRALPETLLGASRSTVTSAVQYRPQTGLWQCDELKGRYRLEPQPCNAHIVEQGRKNMINHRSYVAEQMRARTSCVGRGVRRVGRGAVDNMETYQSYNEHQSNWLPRPWPPIFPQLACVIAVRIERASHRCQRATSMATTAQGDGVGRNALRIDGGCQKPQGNCVRQMDESKTSLAAVVRRQGVWRLALTRTTLVETSITEIAPEGKG